MCLLCRLWQELSIKPLNAIIGMLLVSRAHAVCHAGDLGAVHGISTFRPYVAVAWDTRSVMNVLIVRNVVRAFDSAAKYYCRDVIVVRSLHRVSYRGLGNSARWRHFGHSGSIFAIA